MTKITDFLDLKSESNNEIVKDKYNPFWLKNMVVIGQGAPNKIKKINGRQGRCIALWSEKTGYCKIYPVPYGYLHDWNIKYNREGVEKTITGNHKVVELLAIKK